MLSLACLTLIGAISTPISLEDNEKKVIRFWVSGFVKPLVNKKEPRERLYPIRRKVKLLKPNKERLKVTETKPVHLHCVTKRLMEITGTVDHEYKELVRSSLTSSKKAI